MTSDRKPSQDTLPDDWLSAYLDGELSEQQRQVVAGLLEANSRAARSVEEITAVRHLIRSLPRESVSLAPWSPGNSKIRPDQGLRYADLTAVGVNPVGVNPADVNPADVNSLTPDRPLSHLDDGLESIKSTATATVSTVSTAASSGIPYRSPARRSRLRSLVAIAVSVFGLMAVGASLWLVDFSTQRPLLTRSEPQSVASQSSQAESAPLEPSVMDSELRESELAEQKEVGRRPTEFGFGSMESAPSASTFVAPEPKGAAPVESLSTQTKPSSLESPVPEAMSLAKSMPDSQAESPLALSWDSASHGDSARQGANDPVELSAAAPGYGDSATDHSHDTSTAPLDWLIQEGVSRAVQFDIEVLGSTEPTTMARDGDVDANLPISEARIQNSGSVNWYRSANWSDAEVIDQQNVHPMLQTLQEYQQLSPDSPRSNRNSSQIGQQAARRLDPSGLLPLAVLRFPLDQSLWMDQVIEQWQVQPEWTTPDESIRVLFVSADQLKIVTDRLQEEGDAQLTWLRPANESANRSANESDKNILVIHFYSPEKHSRQMHAQPSNSDR